MYSKHLFKLLLTACIFFGLPSWAQEVSSDDLLKEAIRETNINKNYTRAISLAREGLKLSPDYIDIRMLLGRLYVLTERYEQGEAEFKKVLAKNPLSPETLNALFNLSTQRGKYEDALLYAAALERIDSTSNISLKKADLLKTMGRFDDAANVTNGLLNKNPTDSSIVYLYKDIQFAQGKYRMERGDTTLALTNYQNVLSIDRADTIARNLLINVNLERRNYPAVKDYINAGLPYYKDNSSILLKKLDLLQTTGEFKSAYLLSDSLVRNGNLNSKIGTIRDETFLLSRQNRIGLSSSVTLFDQQAARAWFVHSVSYMRQEKGVSFLGRVNYADRVNRRGYQFELESYPKHGKSYSFVNLAYSDSPVFPKFKASYSYFLPFGKGWESEIGFRYLNAGSDFKGFTGALGRYFNRYWANLKTFQTSSNGKLAGSYILSSRYYLADNSDDYLTAIAGYGFSPEDVARNFDFVERVNLESLRFTLGYQKTVLKRNIIGLFGTWNKQEYTPGKKRNEYDVSVSFQHKF